MKKIIRIGSRESKLAVAQSEIVIQQLKRCHPEYVYELVTMKTTGDIILHKTLDKVGGKGLFVKELDRALLSGEVDLTVHSLKDMPMEIPEELPLLAYLDRQDPRDALVLPEGREQWDQSLPVGCSSLRRKLLLEQLFPGITVQWIRGNVQTRLAKLESGEYGALVLAAAGLKRLGLEKRIAKYFSVEELIPAAGQGILAVQGREEMREFTSCLWDERLARIAESERAFVRTLDGGCSSPVAAYAKESGQGICLTGLYAEQGTNEYRIGKINGSYEDAEKIGVELADELRNKKR